jgi:hypothetical protein
LQDQRPDTPVPGELIWIRRRQWRVRSTHAGSGLTRVEVEGRLSGDTESRSFLIPSDTYLRDTAPRHRAVSSQRALAWLAACAARAHPAWTPGSVITSRTAIYAFQLEPALAMLAGIRRILIADDVGLGKTIQAAVLIAEMLRRCADARVLVLAPAALVTQWADELRDRFEIAARVADAGTFLRLRSDRLYLNNPWTSPGVWLASADYLKQPHVLEAIPASPFDLVVIDEAHTVAGNSLRHAAVDAIARSARHVVMLTATPHDGDTVRFHRLVSLGATGSRADALTTFRRTRTSAVRHVRRLVISPGIALARMLGAIDSFERARHAEAPVDGLALICGVFRKRAISSFAALIASLHRRLEIVNNAPAVTAGEDWTQPGLNFGDNGDDVMTMDEWPAMTVVTGLSRARERSWLERLLSLAMRTPSEGGTADAKLARLTALLRRAREPVVVFTEYRDSLFAIADAVAGSRRIVLLHGGLAASEQRRALRAFLDGHADALIATDVASQGLNLQHRARWVVHFDLPWTPMRIEQRIGRVDRIGQLRAVHVTSIEVRHRAQIALRDRVARREEVRALVSVPTCRRWTRAAEGLARLFARQRMLAARWRGPDPVAAPRARVTAQLLRRLGLVARPGCQDRADELQAIELVEIPLVSGTGEVLERWIGWRNGQAAAVALMNRARTLDARGRRRRSVAAATRVVARRAPTQPGLFTGPVVHGPNVPLANGRIDSVQVGEPRTLLILERRK